MQNSLLHGEKSYTKRGIVVGNHIIKHFGACLLLDLVLSTCDRKPELNVVELI